LATRARSSPQDRSTKQEASLKKKGVSSLTNKLIVAFALLIGLAAASYFFPIVPALQHLCTWVGSLGLLGVLLLALFLAIGSVLFLPASPFIIAGAAVFGFPLGVAGALTGIALGASGGFCLSRWFLRKEISAQFRKHATFRAIDMAIEKEGWKIVILLRLCPIPFGLANYLYGLSAVRFRPYLIASLIGGLPSLLLYCQLGSAGKAGGTRDQYSRNGLRDRFSTVVRSQSSPEIRTRFHSFGLVLNRTFPFLRSRPNRSRLRFVFPDRHKNTT
jgi:uncharacterized membrane protein YdjX (TVP38/TMEM64 family)